MEQQAFTEIKRQTAYKCSIHSLNTGVFVKKEGWESSHIMTDYGDFSRINVIAVIVSKDERVVTIDDGTGKITARFFDDNKRLDSFQIGDPVLIIGRPREYNKQIYITLEIIKRIENMTWISYRRKELSLIKKIRDTPNSQPAKNEPVTVEFESTITAKEKLIKIINQLDTGSGASIDDVITLSKIGNAEDLVQDMLLKGDLFEIRPGRLKLMN